MEGPGRWTSQVAGRGYFVPYGRTQHVQCRHARHCRPAGVQEHITHKRIALELAYAQQCSLPNDMVGCGPRPEG